MTTSHDQPPQSRRQVRQSERENDANAQALSGPFVVQPEPVHPEAVAPTSPFIVSPSTDDTLPPASRAPQTPPASALPPVSGRRSRAAAPSGLVDVPPTSADNPEPLTYSTQAKAGFPQSAPSHSPANRAEQSYRVRDFSPEGRRSAAPSSSPVSPEAAPLDYRTQATPAFLGQAASPAADRAEPVALAEAAPAEAAPVEVETPEVEGAVVEDSVSANAENTGSVAEAAPAESTAAESAADEEVVHKLDDTVMPSSFMSAAPAAASAPQVFLSRRELRARQAAADAAAAASPESAPALVEPVAPVTGPVEHLSSAIDEFEALTRAARENENPETAEAAHEAGRVVAQAAVENAQALADARAHEDAQAQAELIAHREAEQLAQRAAEQRAQSDAESNAQREADVLANAEAPTADPAITSPFEALFTVPGDGPAPASLTTPPSQRERSSAPETPAPAPNLAPAFLDPLSTNTGTHATSTGHWSQQAALEEELPYENTISRQVGRNNVATTTSALVLPIIPHSGEIGNIVADNGEILVTGSIELPRSLGATGGDARRYDDPDVDSLFDSLDNEIVTTDSAPVRAIRAVSTHTATHGVITAKKPKGNRMLVVLAASTVGLAVAAVILLGQATNLL